MIGQNYSNGLVKVAAGGTLTLGSAAQRTTLIVGSGTTNTNETYTGKLDLTGGGAFNAFVGDLTVGQKDGGPGGETGTLIGGNGGAIDIGAAGNTANFYVARSLTGGQSTGIADFSGMTSLTANLNALAVGTMVGSGNAQGTLTLAPKNTINANTITVGTGAGSGSIALGLDNTILAGQLTIGKDYANGSVTIPAGGKLTLGSTAKRTNVTIGSATTNTNETFTGTLDLTDATLVGYLGSVVIGSKNPFPGGEIGTFTISTRPDNHVEANSITIATAPATGTLNFGGGELFANTIAANGGTANFNWAGGRLSVGTFGSPDRRLHPQEHRHRHTLPRLRRPPHRHHHRLRQLHPGRRRGHHHRDRRHISDSGNDQLNVNGSATLAGALNLKLIDGYVPTTGQTFVIAELHESLRHLRLRRPAPPPRRRRLPARLHDQPQPTPRPHARPHQRQLAPASSTTTWSTPGNWDIATAPGTTANVSLNNTTATAKTLTVLSSTTVHRVNLQGTAAPLVLEVPQGVRFGVSNQIAVGPNATLTGAGEIIGDVVIGSPAASAASLLVPGKPTGVFAVSGNLIQQSTGVTRVALAGTSDTGAFGRVSVSGTATLGGTLEVTLPGGFVPVALDPYPVLSYANRVGRFEHYVNLDVPGPLALAPVYSATDLKLIATLPGDTNVDGIINFTDLLTLARHYGAAGSAASWDTGDSNYDNAVNFTDLLTLARNYNQHAAPSAIPGATPEFNADLAAAFATTSVPEPSALLALTLTPLLLRRRRK